MVLQTQLTTASDYLTLKLAEKCSSLLLHYNGPWLRLTISTSSSRVHQKNFRTLKIFVKYFITHSIHALIPVVFLAPTFQGSGVITLPSFFWPTTNYRKSPPDQTLTTVNHRPKYDGCIKLKQKNLSDW